MCYFSFLAFLFTCSTTNTAFIGFFALFIASVVPFAMVAKKEAGAEREGAGNCVLYALFRSAGE